VRLAVVSDIHGNLRALEAVHAQIRQASPDVIVNLGDCVSGPLWPEETAQYLIAEGWPTVRGNHDRIVAGNSVADVEVVDLLVRESLSAGSLSWLAALPPTFREGDILACHGSPADDEVFLLEEDGEGHFYPSAERQILPKLGTVDAELVLCGHTHTPRVAWLSVGQAVLNPGSVGVQAFPTFTATGSPHARYALATRANGKWSFTQHVIGYDWIEAAERAAALGHANWRHGLLTGYAAAST
jgi:putative phosphoesterase